MSCRAVVAMTVYSPSHPYIAGTEHVGFSRSRQVGGINVWILGLQWFRLTADGGLRSPGKTAPGYICDSVLRFFVCHFYFCSL